MELMKLTSMVTMLQSCVQLHSVFYGAFYNAISMLGNTALNGGMLVNDEMEWIWKEAVMA
jgi:hypothetical protein